MGQIVWGTTLSREGKDGTSSGGGDGGGSLTFAGEYERGFARKGGVTRWPRPPT